MDELGSLHLRAEIRGSRQVAVQNILHDLRLMNGHSLVLVVPLLLRPSPGLNCRLSQLLPGPIRRKSHTRIPLLFRESLNMAIYELPKDDRLIRVMLFVAQLVPAHVRFLTVGNSVRLGLLLRRPRTRSGRTLSAKLPFSPGLHLPRKGGGHELLRLSRFDWSSVPRRAGRFQAAHAILSQSSRVWKSHGIF